MPDQVGNKAPKQSKADRTKEHILETALALFAKQGFAETTLRDIAGAAGVSLGLTYRYFARKEDLILSLYERLAAESEADAAGLPRAPMGQRFSIAMNMALDRLEPHRHMLGSLFAIGLSADSEMAVLGERASGVRASVWNLYGRVVSQATDAPKAMQAEQITTVLYASHLLIVLFWLQDRSEGQQLTRTLVDFAGKNLKHLKRLLSIPMFSRPLTEFHALLYPMFGPPPRPAASGEA